VELTSACQEYRLKNSVAQAANKPAQAFGLSRRKFFTASGVSLAASLLSHSVRPGIFGSAWFSFLRHSNIPHEIPAPADLLYPPVDLSYFETPIGHRI
jgi:hypothetical protein